MLQGEGGQVVVRGGGGGVLDVDTDLLGEGDGGLLAPRRPHHRAAPLQLLLLLHRVRQLEALLLLRQGAECRVLGLVTAY